ncbi:MAG: hydrogenase maturation protease [Chloroflexaceae bacterium]
MRSLLIIGYGNPLRGDDGVGWHAAHKLARAICAPHVRVLACHQLTLDLAEPISQADAVIFIDACAPGTCTTGTIPTSTQHLPDGDRLFLQPVHPDPATPGISSHHLTPAALLTSTHVLYGTCPAAVQFGIIGATFDYTEALSADVAACIPRLVAHIQRILQMMQQPDFSIVTYK